MFSCILPFFWRIENNRRGKTVTCPRRCRRERIPCRQKVRGSDPQARAARVRLLGQLDQCQTEFRFLLNDANGEVVVIVAAGEKIGFHPQERTSPAYGIANRLRSLLFTKT
jgi:hypothetical protein